MISLIEALNYRCLCDVRKPRSSAIYQQLAMRVSLVRCHDPALAKLRRILQDWFALGKTRQSKDL